MEKQAVEFLSHFSDRYDFLCGFAEHIGGVGCFYELDHSKLHPELLNSA
ncbi:hypothetical protein OROMI_002432 [Orobanche minor]